MVDDFKHLNSHLPDIKFSYPEVKHVLHKIGHSGSSVYSVLDLKNAFYSINLDEQSLKYMSCCASQGVQYFNFGNLQWAYGDRPIFSLN